MAIKVTKKETKIINVTFDVFNDKGTATRGDGSTFEINRYEYNEMLWDIKKKGAYILVENDYSGNSFQDLMDSL